MQQNGEDARRDLKRKLPQMDRGQERRPYNTNSTPYDRNALHPGRFYFMQYNQRLG
jgi:mRNA-capping enzyme